MITGSVNGMLNTLGDQGHTRFLSAEEANRWNQSLAGEYEGIGAYLDIHDGQAIIVEPIEGSPAEKAGLQSGDFILKIDGKDTYGMALDEVASTIRGEKGTTVVLTIQRPGDVQEFDVSVKRATVEIPSVQWAMLPNDIAIVYLDSFASRSADEMEAALKEAQEQGAKQLILDIRNNGGGLVNEAIGIASQFLPEGTPVLLEQNRDGDREVSEARSGGVALDIPMVVLINFHTASSAEILSGALQDQERAPLIGVRTVGTGTVLTPYELEGGAKLLLGTQQWLTPNGRTIRNQGISPDIEIALPVDIAPLSPREAAALSEDELMESEDVQLVKAIEVLLEQ
jgi:carboxyl-terminal processing protease